MKACFSLCFEMPGLLDVYLLLQYYFRQQRVVELNSTVDDRQEIWSDLTDLALYCIAWLVLRVLFIFHIYFFLIILEPSNEVSRQFISIQFQRTCGEEGIYMFPKNKILQIFRAFIWLKKLGLFLFRLMLPLAINISSPTLASLQMKQIQN